MMYKTTVRCALVALLIIGAFGAYQYAQHELREGEAEVRRLNERPLSAEANRRHMEYVRRSAQEVDPIGDAVRGLVFYAQDAYRVVVP